MCLKACAARRALPNCAGARESSRNLYCRWSKDFLEAGKKRLAGAVTILIALFAIHPLGTSRIGKAFGPIMGLWFLSIAALGIWGVVRHPAVFAALNPVCGLPIVGRAMDFRGCSTCTLDQRLIAARDGAKYRSYGCPKQDSHLLWWRNRTTHKRLCCLCARSPSRHRKRMTDEGKR